MGAILIGKRLVKHKSLEAPDFSFEQQALARGFRYIAGVDEVGRGPIAGPVTAAAVILDPADLPFGVDDSKKLSESKRQMAFVQIMSKARAVAVASLPAEVIDRLNIRQASLIAMRLAVQGLAKKADFVLIDGRDIPRDLGLSAEALIGGDARSLSIAAASIVAKITRDQLMVQLAHFADSYGFEQHKGYPTKAHRHAVLRHGQSSFHRRSFAVKG